MNLFGGIEGTCLSWSLGLCQVAVGLLDFGFLFPRDVVLMCDSVSRHIMGVRLWEQRSRFVGCEAWLLAGRAVQIMARAAKTLLFAYMENGLGYRFD